MTEEERPEPIEVDLATLYNALKHKEEPDEGIPMPNYHIGSRFVGHPIDGAAVRFHPVGLQHMVHRHEIREDLPFELKQAVGKHIDRWHFPKEEKHATE